MSEELVVAGLTPAIGSIGSTFSQGRAVDSAPDDAARQPDVSDRISRTLFVGLAMIESPAIYSLVISLIILLAAAAGDQASGKVFITALAISM